MNKEKGIKIHRLAMVELLSTIDHKIRNLQQFFFVFRDTVDKSSLKDTIEEVAGIQEIYKPYLEMRKPHLEKIMIEEFIKDNYKEVSGCPYVIEADRKKLGFIFDTIIEFCNNEYELTIESTDNKCIIKFSSSALSELSLENLQHPPQELNLLPLYTARKIVERMRGKFNIEVDGLSIEFPCSYPV
ncbi:MAG: hypothetical protein U9N06_04350 [candidate division WOR-3 bacterium]|nr:hypothetical protein [candidate division WOR-3 bacterium]